jgi:uridine kinase
VTAVSLAGAVALITAALRAAPPRLGQTRVLAIDGRSGSGKTTLAAAVAAELEIPVVALEDLYGGWDGLERGISVLAEVLRPLAAGRPASIPRYDWVSRMWTTPTAVPPTPMLIVEGVGAGARAAARCASLVVWLQAATPVRHKRAIDRDGAQYEPFWDQWAAQEDRMLARERTPERADIVIDTGGWDL